MIFYVNNCKNYELKNHEKVNKLRNLAFIKVSEIEMLAIDVNYAYLRKAFGIDTKRLNSAFLSTIDEFMEEEAIQGNTKAANFERDVFNDPDSILELYQLTSPKNRFLILKQMKPAQLQEIMQYLEPEVLYNALKYINQDKLTKIVSELPKEKLATIVFSNFSAEKFLKVTNEKEINKFFQSPKIEKTKILNSVTTLDQDKLQSMMEIMTGEPCKHCDSKEVQEKLAALDDRKFQKTLLSFTPETKSAMVLGMVEENPEYLMEFSTEAMMKPLTQLEKPEFLKTLSVLEPQDHLKMLSALPKDVMPMVVSQINPEVFAQILSKNFQELLKQIAL